MSTERILASEEARGTEIGARLEEWKTAYPAMGILALVAEADRGTAVAALQAECGARGIPLRGAVFPALVTDACLALFHEGRFAFG